MLPKGVLYMPPKIKITKTDIIQKTNENLNPFIIIVLTLSSRLLNLFIIIFIICITPNIMITSLYFKNKCNLWKTKKTYNVFSFYIISLHLIF